MGTFKIDPNVTDIQARGDFILHKACVHHFTGFVVSDVLEQGHADALDNPAFGLDPGQVGVDGGAAVYHSHII